MFRDVLPAERVSENEASRRMAASDIAFDAQHVPVCVLTPQSEEETAALIGAARREVVALHPRGGGWSYTAAYAPQTERSAVVDMSGLQGIAVDAAVETVTAGAGVTWKAL